MAIGEAFLSAFLQVLFDRLASHEFIGLLWGQKYDDLLDNLKITLLTVSVLLNDAEEKQFYSPAVKRWLHMAKDAIYDSEDLLDELTTEALKCKLEAQFQRNPDQVWNWKRLSSSLSPSSRGVDSRLRKIIERLELIAKYKDVLGLKDNVGDKSCNLKKRSVTTSLLDESCVFGRLDDKDMIIQMLFRDEHDNNGKIGVVPIVGMGGIGKTTLAQLVYNDQRVEKHFDIKVWVCVSDQFDVVTVTKTILRSVTLNSFDLDDLNLLQVSLKESLTGKRFLLVLDDVWGKRNSDWDLLWSPLEAGTKGSKVLITTRNCDVAASIGTVSAHHLRGLSSDDCWLLFTSQAFGKITIDDHPNFAAIGREIMKKCEGLPLAVKRLAMILLSRNEEDQWKDVLNMKLWEFPDEASDILQTLSISYHHLPAHLKQCFAYCSVFPTEYEFDKETLILLWMAEGFLQHSDTKKKMEEVGIEYFHELLSRSFFVQSTCDSKKFLMHTFLKELALFVSRDFCFRLEDKAMDDNQTRGFVKARHSSYIRSKRDVLAKFEAFNGAECLRTFLPLDPTGCVGISYLPNKVPNELLPKLRYLRVLSFNACRITKLSNSIGNLRHLRFLDLSYTAIKELPESTSTLYNLQTLMLVGCHYLTKLPTEVGNLSSLRHLCISGSGLREMPLQICELKNLQTLSTFVVGKDGGSGISGLRQMSQLQGSLLISGLQNVDNFVDAMEANLKSKQKLDQLVLQWNPCFHDSVNDMDKAEVPFMPQPRDDKMGGYRSSRFPSYRETVDAYSENPVELKMQRNNSLNDSRNDRVEMFVLEMLQPHKNIKQVTIEEYGGITFPSWIESPLFSNINFLKLTYCTKCAKLPALGQLPSLKDLIVEGMEGIKSIGVEFFQDFHSSIPSFPSLKTLKFENMLNWENWDSSEIENKEDFPRLQEIDIQNCPKLWKFSHRFSALKRMSLKGCEALVSLPRLSMHDSSFGQGKEFPCLLELTIFTCPNLKELPSVLPSLETLELDGCQNLSELPKLPSIRDLELKKCDSCLLQNVIKLTSLAYLRVCQIPMLTCLLEGFLKHLTNLEELRIAHLSELTTLSNNTGLENLQNLQRLEISWCPQLKQLPDNLYRLSSLDGLRLSSCPSLIHFPRKGLPSNLTALEIKGCEALQSIPYWTTKTNSINSLSSLKYIIIEGCTSLASLPKDKLSNTLMELEIQDCTNLKTLPEGMIHENTSLEFLRVAGCHSITSFPEGTFGQPTIRYSEMMNLKQFIIHNCTNLKFLPEGLNNLVHLHHLEITDCPIILSFPESGLPTMLTIFKVSNCSSLKTLPSRMYRLTSLEEVCINGCSSIVSFPEGGLPVNLMSLTILDCEGLRPSFQWGMHRLVCLTHLVFGGCQGLVSFPEDWLLPTSLSSLQIQRLPNLRSFPKGLKDVTCLDNLEIWECENLQILQEQGSSDMLQNLDF